MVAIQCAKTLAYNLRSLRRTLGKTQERMAQDCGISYRLYQKLEACRANPTLHSLDRIARAAKVTASDLIRLRNIQAPGTREEFLDDFKARFREFKRAVAVRTHEGVVLWANRRHSAIKGMSPDSGPYDLMKTLPPSARETLRFQLECERNDVVQPYINQLNLPGGEFAYMRFYPTIVMPPAGLTPYFSAVYITDIRDDTQKNYYEFCELLLRCL